MDFTELAPLLKTVVTVVAGATPAGGLLSAAIAIASDAPELASAIQSDIDALSGGTLTPEELQSRWTAMRTGYMAAEAKWAAAASAAAEQPSTAVAGEGGSQSATGEGSSDLSDAAPVT